MSENHRRKPTRDRAMPDRLVSVRQTDRDRQAVTFVALHGAVTANQLVEQGFFGSKSRANRRLRALFDAGYLRRCFLANGAYASATYMLGPEGCSVVAEATGLDYTDLTRQSRRTPARMFLEHHQAVVELRLAAQADALKRDAIIETYLAEAECRHEYIIGAAGKEARRIVKPDGYMVVRKGDQSLAALLEVDRGCVSLGQMAKTFDRYRAYLSDGAFLDCYNQADFQVLVVTTAGLRRIGHLMASTTTKPPLIRFTTFEDVHRLGFFGPIWRRCGCDGQEALTEGPSAAARGR